MTEYGLTPGAQLMPTVFGQFFLPALLGFTAFFCIILSLRFVTKLMQRLTNRLAKGRQTAGTQRVEH